VVEAVCRIEQALSAKELDMKLHALLHLVDSICTWGERGNGKRLTADKTDVPCVLCLSSVSPEHGSPSCCAGPLYQTSMFQPESLWGVLARWAHNKAHLESSMFFAALDREATRRALQAASSQVMQASYIWLRLLCVRAWAVHGRG
jgi:hypothetical protein